MQKRIEADKQRATREKEDVDNSFRAFRSGLLLFWLVTNALWMWSMTNYVSSSCYLKFISYVVAVFNVIRFLGASVFLVFRIHRRLRGGAGVGANGSYQHRLPDEWQSHYKSSSNAAARRNDTAQQHQQLFQMGIAMPASPAGSAPYQSMGTGR